MTVKLKRFIAREFLLFIVPLLVISAAVFITAFILKSKRTALYHQKHALEKKIDQYLNPSLYVDFDTIQWRLAEDSLKTAESKIKRVNELRYMWLGENGYDSGFGVLYVILLIILYPVRGLILSIRWAIKILVGSAGD